MCTVLKLGIISHLHTESYRETPESENPNPLAHNHHNIRCSFSGGNAGNLQCHQLSNGHNYWRSADIQRLAPPLDDRIMDILGPTDSSSLHVPTSEFPSRPHILRNNLPDSNANLHTPKRSKKTKHQKQRKPTLTTHRTTKKLLRKPTLVNNNFTPFSTTIYTCC